jgi:hypothetical protein
MSETPKPTDGEDTTSANLHCLSCGKLALAESKFCGYCGGALDSEKQCRENESRENTAKDIAEVEAPRFTQVATSSHSIGRLIALAVLFLVGLAVAITFTGGRSLKFPAIATSTARPAASSVPTPIPSSSQSATAIQIPHEKSPEDIWREATPATRRSILANSVRRKWKNVRVENSGVIMTVTHSGMDEHGAHQIIDDVGKLASEAGFRRIDLVRAGGVCEVTYTRPYCEVACQEAAGCYPAGECNMICCSIYGGHVSQIPEVRQESCPPHTWVYNVPSS